jgi:hypothetical protein
MSTQARAAIAALASLQISLFAAAQWDLLRRSPEEVRGSKWLWRALAFVNTFGPIAYFSMGRRRRPGGPSA